MTTQLETTSYDGCTKCIHTSMHADLSSISPSCRETETVSKCNAQKVLLVRAVTTSVSCAADRQYTCLCECLCPRLLITSGMMWRDMDLLHLIKQLL